MYQHKEEASIQRGADERSWALEPTKHFSTFSGRQTPDTPAFITTQPDNCEETNDTMQIRALLSALQITGESACISTTPDNSKNSEAVQHINAILDALEKSNKNKEQFALLAGVRSLLLAMMSLQMYLGNCEYILINSRKAHCKSLTRLFS
ncbi:hypothetical protein BJ912DRAFT_925122 [Pholiota molesta]|nr:hypothetical protein BJ912DRAFT_925122 [Pholiota molesta]